MSDLRVNEVYGPVPQGEGPHIGEPAIFVRLAGCNLDCSWCDTPYSWDWKRYRFADESHRRHGVDLLDEVRAKRGRADLVVLTGGEPLIQQRAATVFVTALAALDAMAVDVETNGTVAPDPVFAAAVRTFVVSPKLHNSDVAAERRIRPDVLAAFNALGPGRAALKFVVEDEREEQEIADVAALAPALAVYVMPQGTQREVVARRAADLEPMAMGRGWRMTTRLHVLVHGDRRGV